MSTARLLVTKVAKEQQQQRAAAAAAASGKPALKRTPESGATGADSGCAQRWLLQRCTDTGYWTEQKEQQWHQQACIAAV